MEYNTAKRFIATTIKSICERLSPELAKSVNEAWKVVTNFPVNDCHNTATPVHGASAALAFAIDELVEYGEGFYNIVTQLKEVKNQLDMNIDPYYGISKPPFIVKKD